MPTRSEQEALIEEMVVASGLTLGSNFLPDNYAAVLLESNAAQPNFALFAKDVGEFVERVSKSGVLQRVEISTNLLGKTVAPLLQEADDDQDRSSNAVAQRTALAQLERLVDNTLPPEALRSAVASFSANATNLQTTQQLLDRLLDKVATSATEEPDKADYLAVARCLDQLEELLNATDAIASDSFNNRLADDEAQSAIVRANDACSAMLAALQDSTVGLREIRTTGARQRATTESEDEEAALARMDRTELFSNAIQAAKTTVFADVLTSCGKLVVIAVAIFAGLRFGLGLLNELSTAEQAFAAMADQRRIFRDADAYRTNATFLRQLLLGAEVEGYYKVGADKTVEFVEQRTSNRGDIFVYFNNFSQWGGRFLVRLIDSDPMAWGIVFVLVLIAFTYRSAIGATYYAAKVNYIRARRRLRRIVMAPVNFFRARGNQAAIAAKDLVSGDKSEGSDEEPASPPPVRTRRGAPKTPPRRTRAPARKSADDRAPASNLTPAQRLDALLRPTASDKEAPDNSRSRTPPRRRRRR